MKINVKLNEDGEFVTPIGVADAIITFYMADQSEGDVMAWQWDWLAETVEHLNAYLKYNPRSNFEEERL